MDIEKLVNLVQSKPPLWNQAHPDHQNRFIVSKLWDAIAEEMHLERNVIQKKWKYLRDYMRNEQTKLPKKRSGDDGTVIKSSWPYYSLMCFIKDQLKNRKSEGNLNRTQEDNDKNESMPNVDNTDYTLETQDDTSVGSPSTPAPVSQNEEGNEVESDNEPRVVISTRKRKRANEVYGQALLNVEQQKLAYLQQKIAKKNSGEVPNDDQMFFNSLLPYVAKIPAHKKLLFRTKVQELVQQMAFQDVTPWSTQIVINPEWTSPPSTSSESQMTYYSNE